MKKQLAKITDMSWFKSNIPFLSTRRKEGSMEARYVTGLTCDVVTYNSISATCACGKLQSVAAEAWAGTCEVLCNPCH